MANITANKSGNPVMFKSIDEAPIRSLKVHFAPVQAGSGDPSPTNIRPISGWTGCEMYRAGKNLLNTDYSAWSLRSTVYAYINDVVPKGQTARFTFTDNDTSVDISGCNIGFVYENLDNATPASYSWIIDNGVIKRYTNTAVNGIPGLLCQNVMIYPQTEQTLQRLLARYNIMVEVGSVATEYEPYQPRTAIPITFPSEAGTVYGGYVDVVKGEVVTEWAEYTITGNEKFSDTSTGQKIITTPNVNSIGGIKPATSKSVCDAISTFAEAKTYVSLNVAGSTDGFGFGENNYIIVGSNQYANWNSLVGEKIVFKLATPQTYTLTPIQLSTLRGQNTIISTANGTIDAEYDLHEAGDIAAIRRRVNQSAPHIVTSTPADIVTFNTDLAAPIKQLKCEFLPVQEGSGDPSPDNVRPISGWDGINVTCCEKSLFGGLDFANALHDVSNTSIIDTTNKTVTFDRYKTKQINVLDCKCKRITAIITYSNTANNNSLQWRYSDGTWSEIKLVNSNGEKTTSVFISDASKNVIAIRLNYFSQGLTTIYYNETGFFEGVITEDDFTPYVGTTYPITFPSEAGTVYGGYVDLVKGEVVATHRLVHLGASDIVGISAGANNTYRPYTIDIAGALANADAQGFVDNPIFCDKITTVKTATWNPPLWQGYINGNRRLVFVVPTEMSTVALVQDWMTSVGGFDLVYPLATPIHTPIAPVILNTLKGTNNIWSNANGPTTVSYWTH